MQGNFLPFQGVEIRTFNPRTRVLPGDNSNRALINSSSSYPFTSTSPSTFPTSTSRSPEHDTDQSMEDDEDTVGFFSSDDGADGDQGDGNYEDSEGDDAMDEGMPASMQSWSYLTSSSDDLSDYEWGMLPGMNRNGEECMPTWSAAKATAQRPSIAQVIDQFETPNKSRAIGPLVPTSPVYLENSTCNGEDRGLLFYDTPAKEFDKAQVISQEFWAPTPKMPRHSHEEYMGENVPSSPPMMDFAMDEDTLPEISQQGLGSPINFSRDSSFMFVGESQSSKRRKVTPVPVPTQPIHQMRQQQPQQGQQFVPQRLLRTYRNQQVKRANGYQYIVPPFLVQSPAQIATQQLEDLTEYIQAAAATNFSSPATSFDFRALGCHGDDNFIPITKQTQPPRDIPWKQYVAEESVLDEPLTPSPPLGRRGGRPVPPDEKDPRWNIWTVGNLEIRSTASGVGVKHLKEVLFRDDGSIGCRRSKWTHKRLVAEVMGRRNQQMTTNKVVGRPQGYLPHQGWWFYIETS